jgi:tRNA-Thr(GGU) m(6)t(6)A37 methyltransferase TsaA
MDVIFHPIAFVKNSRTEAIDDNWSAIESEIHLANPVPTEAFEGINSFSHLEIIYDFHQAGTGNLIYSGHPRGNKNYPSAGIYTQRKKDRPNRIGTCIAELILHHGRMLKVRNLDAIDGTPVLDINPFLHNFCPIAKSGNPNGWQN